MTGQNIVSVTMPAELEMKGRKLAKKEKISFSKFVEKALEEQMKR